jgi:hypothetical protein
VLHILFASSVLQKTRQSALCSCHALKRRGQECPLSKKRRHLHPLLVIIFPQAQPIPPRVEYCNLNKSGRSRKEPALELVLDLNQQGKATGSAGGICCRDRSSIAEKSRLKPGKKQKFIRGGFAGRISMSHPCCASRNQIADT